MKTIYIVHINRYLLTWKTDLEMLSEKIGLQKNVQNDRHFVQRYDINIQLSLGCRIINEFVFSNYFAFLCVSKHFLQWACDILAMGKTYFYAYAKKRCIFWPWREYWNCKWSTCAEKAMKPENAVLTSLPGWTSSHKEALGEKKKEITWSVEEDTSLRVREQGLKETEFISDQQILISHLLCYKYWLTARKSIRTCMEPTIQWEEEKWKHRTSMY